MADYLVPMAAEMPDIVCAHVETPTKTSMLGAKGAGEAGTGGAPRPIMNAGDDAPRPLGAKGANQPITPEGGLPALGKETLKQEGQRKKHLPWRLCFSRFSASRR